MSDLSIEEQLRIKIRNLERSNAPQEIEARIDNTYRIELNRLKNETESLMAELAEARAQADCADETMALYRHKLERANAHCLSLQSHNAKLREALGKALTASDPDCDWDEIASVIQDALSSQPDNELRDRVRDALEYANELVKKFGDGKGHVRFTELLSSL